MSSFSYPLLSICGTNRLVCLMACPAFSFGPCFFVVSLNSLLYAPCLLSRVVRAGAPLLPFWAPFFRDTRLSWFSSFLAATPAQAPLLILLQASSLHLLPQRSQPVPCFKHHPHADDSEVYIATLTLPYSRLWHPATCPASLWGISNVTRPK